MQSMLQTDDDSGGGGGYRAEDAAAAMARGETGGYYATPPPRSMSSSSSSSSSIHNMGGQLIVRVGLRDLEKMDRFSKSDPQVKVFLKNLSGDTLLQTTEKVQNNHNPDFTTEVRCKV
jgi:hypothetical protein